MRITLFFKLLLITTLSYAQEEPICNESDIFKDIKKITGSNCLIDTEGEKVARHEFTGNVKTANHLTKVCNQCKGEALISLSESGNDQERKGIFGKAILNELQKNLTFMTVDLMKVRNTFKLDFDAKKATGSCKISNLKRPACLTPEQSKSYDKQIQALQNTLAQEMANILSKEPNLNHGLLDRKAAVNSCHISDNEILFAQNRYIESNLNYASIHELIKIVQSKSKLEDHETEKLKQAKKHPILHMLISNPKLFSKFVTKLGPSDSGNTIVEKLYSKEIASEFGKSIDHRCEEAFSQTSKALEENFCNKSMNIVANDPASIEAVENLPFSEFVSDEEASKQIQTHCAYNSSKNKNLKPISLFQSELHKDQDLDLAKGPISTFKSAAFNESAQAAKSSTCSAMNGNPDCKTMKDEPSCKMLEFLELSKTSKPYQEMAKASGENINLILRSLVGEGRPESQEHLVLLQNEGILPGGTIADKPVQQDPETFHKTVSNNNGSTSPSLNQKAGDPKLTGRKIASNDPNGDSEISGSNSPYSGSKTGSSPDAPEFSNLSGEEQDQFMDRLGRMGKIRKGKSRGRGHNTPPNSEQVVKNGGKTHWAKPARYKENTETDVNDTPVISGSSQSSIAGVGGGSTSGAGSTSAGAGAGAGGINKGFRSYNSALLKANENMGTPNVDGTPTVNELSKTKTGENEINIQVEDAELAKIKEFNEDLKKLLAAHNAELALVKVGEKFVVKLNDFLIDVHFDPKTGLYKAECRNGEISEEYKTTISNYFNVTLKQGPGKIKELNNAFQVTIKNLDPKP